MRPNLEPVCNWSINRLGGKLTAADKRGLWVSSGSEMRKTNAGNCGNTCAKQIELIVESKKKNVNIYFNNIYILYKLTSWAWDIK